VYGERAVRIVVHPCPLLNREEKKGGRGEDIQLEMGSRRWLIVLLFYFGVCPEKEGKKKRGREKGSRRIFAVNANLLRIGRRGGRKERGGGGKKGEKTGVLPNRTRAKGGGKKRKKREYGTNT